MALETVTQTSGPYTAGALADTFAYDFRILESSHIKVYLDDVLQTSGYSVTGVGDSNGGNVIFDTPLDGGEIVFLARETDEFQEVNYSEHDKFPAETHEEALDKLTMLLQELGRRVLRVPTNSPLPGIDVPLLSSGVGKFLSVNGTGDGVIWATPGSVLPDTYNPPFPGAVERTATSKLAEHVSLLDFGADPAGVVPIDTAWEAMMDYAAAVNVASGGQDGVRCEIPRGEYVYSDTLSYGNLPRGIVIEGEGSWCVRLKPTGDFTGKPLILCEDGYDCQLNGVQIEKPSVGTATFGLEIRRTNAMDTPGTSRFAGEDVEIGYYGAGAIARAVGYTLTGTDANNELGQFRHCDFRASVAAVSVDGFNSLLHEFIGCLYTAPVGFEMKAGSVRLFGGGMNCSDVDYDLVATTSGKYSDSHPVVNAVGVYHESSGKLVRSTSTADTGVQVRMTNCEGEGATASTSIVDLRGSNARAEFVNCRYNTGQANVRLKVTGANAALFVNGGSWGVDELEVNNVATFTGWECGSGALDQSFCGAGAKINFKSCTGVASSTGLLSWFKNTQLNVIEFLVDSFTNASWVTCKRVRLIHEGLTSWAASAGNSAFMLVNASGWNVFNNSGAARLIVDLVDGITTFIGTANIVVQMQSANGAKTMRKHASVVVNSSAAGTLTASNLIPAGALNVMVTARVTTAFGVSTGLTSFKIGDGTDDDRWGAAAGITSGATSATFTITSMPCYAAATDVVLTANGGNFDATGAVRLTVHYDQVSAPTS